jgi:catechol 2,3-dioxygenase-like lactoylglutathione lyase family enzyme
MIDIEGLAHIGIRVSEFGRCIAFYRQFGFEVVREDYGEHVVALRHRSGLELNLLDSATTDNHARNILMDEETRYPGVTHVALRVRDISEAERDVTAMGMVITEGPVTFGDGSTSLFIRDPDRNVIELSQPRHRAVSV